MFLEGLTMHSLDNNGASGAQESSPDKESNDSIDHFSANKPSTSKKWFKTYCF